MPAPRGPRQMSTMTSPGWTRPGPWLLMAAIAARSRVNTRAGPTLRYRPSGPTTDGYGRALDHGSLRGQVPSGERYRASQPPALCPLRVHDDLVRVDAVDGAQPISERLSPLGAFPPVEDRPEPLAGDRKAALVQQPLASQVEHDLGDAAREEHADGGMVPRAVRKHVDEPGHAAVHVAPVLDGRPPEPGGVGDGREMKKQVRGPPEGGVDRHRVPDRRVGQDLARGDAPTLEAHQRARGPARHVRPDRL